MVKLMAEDKSFNNIIMALFLALSIPVAGMTYADIYDNELKDHYKCTAETGRNAGEIMEFKGGLSGTQHRAYPYTDSKKGYKDCGDLTSDTWMKLLNYSLMIGEDPYDLIEAQLVEEEPEPEPEPEPTPDPRRTGSGAPQELCVPGEPWCVPKGV